MNDYAVSFREACRRLGISVRHGTRLVSAGCFPVPCLPLVTPRAHRKYSSASIDLYLREAPTQSVRGPRLQPSA